MMPVPFLLCSCSGSMFNIDRWTRHFNVFDMDKVTFSTCIRLSVIVVEHISFFFGNTLTRIRCRCIKKQKKSEWILLMGLCACDCVCYLLNLCYRLLFPSIVAMHIGFLPSLTSWSLSIFASHLLQQNYVTFFA
jgi:hypothetical protein